MHALVKNTHTNVCKCSFGVSECRSRRVHIPQNMNHSGGRLLTLINMQIVDFHSYSMQINNYNNYI